jgi:uncharacterized protein (DUF1015 family)
VPRFEPFAGLRFATDLAGAVDDVSCPSYDVITPDVHRKLLARSPYNVVRLELPDDTSPMGQGGPASARATLDAWRRRRVLRQDPGPVFYGYRTTVPAGDGPGQQTVGLIGALTLEPPGAGILPHEETTGGSRTGHSRLLEALRVNVSAIWALTPTTGLAALAAPPPPAPAVEVVAHALDEEGVRHELWLITEPDRIRAVRELVGSQPLVLADGHHRYETALAYDAARRAEGHLDDVGAGALMTYVVELSEEQLPVQAIHRLVAGLDDPTQLLAALDRSFSLEATAPADRTIAARMSAAGALAVITRDGTWLARPDVATAVGVDDLDSRRLDAVLADLPEVRVSYQHGWEHAAAAVAAGHADAAVLLRPPSVRQIADLSRGGVRMPPKTTFFWPKPRTGLVLRPLDP